MGVSGKNKFYLVRLLLVLLSGFSLTVQAQLCSGNLSEPVIQIDFGERGSTGPQFAGPLGTGETTYTYKGNNDLFDGEYNVSDNVMNGRPEWHNVPDHTPGDVNGYMGIFNASFTTGEFYRKRVTGLCENTLFEFSAWALNALPQGVCGASTVKPDVRFEIRATDGSLLAFSESGVIEDTFTPIWIQYGVSFITGTGITEVDVVMLNNAPGGCGNDIAIDDIEFRACGDIAAVASVSGMDTFCADAAPPTLDLESQLTGSTYTTPVFQWQVFPAGGAGWEDIPGATNPEYTIPTLNNGYIYRYKVAESIANLNNGSCSVLSDVFTLTVHPNYDFVLDPVICEPDTYTMPDGSTENTSGTYVFNFITAENCDSIYTVNLTVNPSYTFTLDPVICDNALPYILPDGSSVNTSGTYTNDFVTGEGCDSNYTINLTINPAYLDTVRIGICDGGNYTLPDGTVVAPVTGFYPVTLPTAENCDSTIVTRISVDSVYSFSSDIEICAGESYFLENGVEVTISGTYTAPFVSQRGCDSIYTTNLIVNPSYNLPTVTIEICDNQSYMLPDGLEVTAAGDYSTILSTNKSCDSIINTRIVVNPTYTTVVQDLFCEGDEYTLVDGSTVTDAGSFTVILPTVDGCDSTFNYQLGLIPAQQTNQTILICEGDNYISPTGILLDQAGVYRDTVKTALNCDSVIITNLILAQVDFPTAFSPNNNSENDGFRAIPPADCNPFVSDFELQIFNRWGQKIFETTNFLDTWNGNFNGENSPADTYLWYARYTFNGNAIEKNGSTALIR